MKCIKCSNSNKEILVDDEDYDYAALELFGDFAHTNLIK